MAKKKQQRKQKSSGPYAATGGFISGIVPRLFGAGNRQKGISIVKDD